jgi:hypothetical protein
VEASEWETRARHLSKAQKLIRREITPNPRTSLLKGLSQPVLSVRPLPFSGSKAVTVSCLSSWLASRITQRLAGARAQSNLQHKLRHAATDGNAHEANGSGRCGVWRLRVEHPRIIGAETWPPRVLGSRDHRLGSVLTDSLFEDTGLPVSV